MAKQLTSIDLYATANRLLLATRLWFSRSCAGHNTFFFYKNQLPGKGNEMLVYMCFYLSNRQFIVGRFAAQIDLKSRALRALPPGPFQVHYPT